MKSKTPKKTGRPRNKLPRKLEALIAEQGVSRTADFEHLLGSAADLWEDEDAFKRFLDTVKAVRQEKG